MIRHHLTVLSMILLLLSAALRVQAQQVSGHAVETYASGVTTGTRLSFDPSGVLYVGHEDNGAPTRIWRVPAQPSPCVPATLYGDSDLPDPDAVVFDPTGLVSGVPGAVLVGGACAGQGCVWAILPDETTIIAIQSPAFSNVSEMVLDASGRLFFASGSDRTICRSDGPGQSVSLFTLPAASHGIDFDPAVPQRLATSDGTGAIRFHDLAAGTSTVHATLPTTRSTSIRFARGGAFSGDLYALEYGANGRLFRISSNGTVNVLVTGFNSGGLGFGPDGALYVTHRPTPTTGTTAVLRIVPAPGLPSIPGHRVGIRATGLGNGVSISFDAAGNLYAGHEDNGLPTRIWRVASSTPAGGPAALFGNLPIPDPDIAVFEPLGLVSGTPGSVLVGGACSGQGCIHAVRPDETTITAIMSPAFPNVSSMVVAPSGPLYFGTGSGRTVCRSDGPGQVVVLLTLPAASHGIDLDPADPQRLVTTAGDGAVRFHHLPANSSVVHALLPTTRSTSIRFAHGGPFGNELYAVEYGMNGSLFRVDSSGGVTVLGTGFNAGGLGFGPEGALYVTHHPDPFSALTIVLRIVPDGSQACFGNYGSGFAGTQGVPTLSLSSAPAPGVSFDLAIGNSLGAPTPAWVLAGDAPASIPTNLAGPILVAPPWTMAPIQLPAQGLAVPVTLPSGLPSGLTFYLQVFEQDPGALSGWSSSPGLVARLGI